MSVAMNLTWSAVGHVERITYQVQYRPLGAVNWINADGPTEATSKVLTGLSSGMTYEVRRIISNTPWRETSATSRVVAGVAPNAPTELRATA